MPITRKQFLKKPKKYLKLALEEDIAITRHGKIIARVTKPKEDFYKVFEPYLGIIPEGFDYGRHEFEEIEEVD